MCSASWSSHFSFRDTNSHCGCVAPSTEFQGVLALISTAEFAPARIPDIPPAEYSICSKGQGSFSYLKECKRL